MATWPYAKAGWWILVAGLALFGCAAATATSLAVNIVAILLLPVLFIPERFTEARRQPMLVLFFCAIAGLMILFSINARSLRDLGEIAGFLPLALCIPVYIVAASISARGVQHTVFALCLAGAAIAAAIAIYQVVMLGLPRAEGLSLTGALIFARLAMLLGFAASCGFFVLRDRWRFVFILGPVFGLVAAVLAEARGVLAAAPVLLLLFVGFVFLGTSIRAKWRLLAVLALAVIAVTVAAEPFTQMDRFTNVISRVGTIFHVPGGPGADGLDESTRIRLDYYAAAWQLYLQRPVLGYGWARFAEVAATVLDAKTYGQNLKAYFQFHNDFLNFAVAGGVFGIAAYFTILAAPVVGAIRSARDAYFSPRLYAALTITCLYLVSGLTDITLGNDMPTTAYAMISAILLGILREPEMLR